MKTKQQLHRLYSSSASILAIQQRYSLSMEEVAKTLSMPLEVLRECIKGILPIGIDNYKKIMEHFPEFTNRVDYDDLYRNN